MKTPWRSEGGNPWSVVVDDDLDYRIFSSYRNARLLAVTPCVANNGGQSASDSGTIAIDLARKSAKMCAVRCDETSYVAVATFMVNSGPAA